MLIIQSGKPITDSGHKAESDQLGIGIDDHHVPEWVIGMDRNTQSPRVVKRQ